MIKAFISDPRCLTLNIQPNLEIVSRETAEIFILYQDYLNEEKGYMDEALKRNIPVLVIQHGRQATRDYSKDGRDLRANKICLWGMIDYNRMRGLGYPAEKLVITGCPILEALPKQLPPGFKKPIIFFSPKYYPYLTDPNFDILKELLRTPYKIIIKTIADDVNLHNYFQWQQIYPGRIDIVSTSPKGRPLNHLTKVIGGLMKSCIFVGIEESINELMAEAMDIPVVMVTDAWIPKETLHFNGQHDVMRKGLAYSRAVYRTKLNNLFNELNRVMKHDDKKEERFDVAREEGGLGLPTNQLIMNEINKLVKPILRRDLMALMKIDYSKITEKWEDFFWGFVDDKNDKKFIKLKEIEKIENVIVHRITKNKSRGDESKTQVMVYYFMGLGEDGCTCQYATLITPKEVTK